MRVFAAMFVAAGTLGMAFAVLPARAQDYAAGSGPDYQGVNAGGANEVVIVSPHFHAQTNRLNAPPEGISISRPVSYADLDLRTGRGAHELRVRVRSMAARICDDLRSVYPVAIAPHEPCIRSVLNDSMPKAEAAITDVRMSARRGEYYGGEENDDSGVW
jgi:UrcA family protein